MRELLKTFVETQQTFQATVNEFRSRKKDNCPTVLLINIYLVNNNCLVADHLWIGINKRLKEIHPQVGDRIQFTATVYAYTKKNGSLNYSLKNLIKITKL